jgi:hypothetical protein
VTGAGERLVEEEELRLGRERDRQFELALFAMREETGRKMGARGEGDGVEKLHRRLVQRRLLGSVAEEAEARAGTRLHGERDVFQRREAGQDRGDLEGARKPAPHPLMHGKARDVLTLEQDTSGVWRGEAGDLVDERGLASAVRADHRVKLTREHFQIHVIGHDKRAIGLAQPVEAKERLSHGRPAEKSRGCRRGRRGPPAPASARRSSSKAR